MGQEIDKSIFTKEDENEFTQRLREETKILMEWFKNKRFETPDLPMCGLEVEAWLADKDCLPSPSSLEFIDMLKDPDVVPEISRFNFELNSEPHLFQEGMLNFFEKNLTNTWSKCEQAAQNLGLNAVMIGSIPTVRNDMLTLDYISPQQRYYALNSRILELKKNQPVVLDIKGKDHLHVENDHVLTEAAATSFQIHLQVSQENAARYYNASVILSSFMVALSANSPYFYGKELWNETRIALFEQSVSLPGYRDKRGLQAKRVGMGNGYVKESLFELFLDNLDGYPVLLPMVMDEDPAWLTHLRLQNGTIWRWNRPIIGLSKDGTPHLRIEHRTPSSGPTIKDMVANLAFYVGAAHVLANLEIAPESQLSFEDACDNFYKAAQFGFDAEIKWIDGKEHNIQELLLNELLPMVEKEIKNSNLSEQEFNDYIEDIIRPRIKSGQTGSAWQKAYVETHGSNFQQLTQAYLKNQLSGKPVHLWSV